MIKKTVLICFIYFCMSNIANGIETGLYLSPKFIFSASSLKVDNKNVNHIYPFSFQPNFYHQCPVLLSSAKNFFLKPSMVLIH